MPLDILTARRVLRATQRGLPVEHALVLIEAILDGHDAEEMEQGLEELIAAALRRETEELTRLRNAIRLSPHEEEVLYGG